MDDKVGRIEGVQGCRADVLLGDNALRPGALAKAGAVIVDHVEVRSPGEEPAREGAAKKTVAPESRMRLPPMRVFNLAGSSMSVWTPPVQHIRQRAKSINHKEETRADTGLALRRDDRRRRPRRPR